MRNEKGIALVAALCISTVLLIFAIALTYRMSTYLRMLATSKEKNESYYAATAGIEQVRDGLKNAACRPPNWCGLIGVAGNPLNANYQTYLTGTFPPTSTTMTSLEGVFPTSLVGKATMSTYTIYLKDNDEFDNDYTNDSDELIIAVATATGNNETRTSVEAGLLFDAEALNPYKQFGQTNSKKGSTKEYNVTVTARNVNLGG